MATSKTHWDQVFGAKEEEHLTWFQEDAEPSLGLIQNHAPSTNAAIIDVGAGASRLADGLIKSGFSDLTLLDISGRALGNTLERLRKKAGEVKTLVTDITQWTPARQWQVWHDRAVFHFLTSPQDQNAYLKAMKTATQSGALIIMGTFALDGPEKCSGLPVQRYSPQTLADRLGAGFTLIKSTQHSHATPAGNVQKFSFSVFVRD